VVLKKKTMERKRFDTHSRKRNIGLAQSLLAESPKRRRVGNGMKIRSTTTTGKEGGTVTTVLVRRKKKSMGEPTPGRE